ncbi:hypothetical protein Y032_0052g2247 [Ancylostoma ceylanicum]|uniref:Uncharacterized protein n=1 Tax=Ancylostoma ceylanicum TaxID=53326 RepID=A0A016U760_9BILA|nr:hypothetical protein Y032_0052g2247 [Ancylostoma ceylanicum]
MRLSVYWSALIRLYKRQHTDGRKTARMRAAAMALFKGGCWKRIHKGPPTCEVRQRLVRVSPDFTMTAGDRHMDKVKEETSDERGDELRLAAIHGAVTWRSIRIISTTHDFELAKSEDTLM